MAMNTPEIDSPISFVVAWSLIFHSLKQRNGSRLPELLHLKSDFAFAMGQIRIVIAETTICLGVAFPIQQTIITGLPGRPGHKAA